MQSSIDDYIRQRVPPRDVPNRTDLDISEIMSTKNKDMEIDLASESDSLSLTDTTPKSKRGRTPSLSSDVDLPSDTDLAVPSIDSTPKNKGGRPPKPKMGFRGTRSKSAVTTKQVDEQATEFEIVISH